MSNYKWINRLQFFEDWVVRNKDNIWTGIIAAVVISIGALVGHCSKVEAQTLSPEQQQRFECVRDVSAEFWRIRGYSMVGLTLEPAKRATVGNACIAARECVELHGNTTICERETANWKRAFRELGFTILPLKPVSDDVDEREALQ